MCCELSERATVITKILLDDAKVSFLIAQRISHIYKAAKIRQYEEKTFSRSQSVYKADYETRLQFMTQFGPGDNDCVK